MPLFTRFCTSQVVQDLFHQQYPTCMKRTFIFKNALVRDMLVPRRVNQRNSEFDFFHFQPQVTKTKLEKGASEMMNTECAWICTKPQNSRLGRSDHIVLVCYRLSTPDPSIPSFILQPATSSHQTISLSKWPFRIRDIREYFWSGHLTTFHFFSPSFTKAKRFVLLILLHMAVRIAVTAKLSPLFTSQLFMETPSVAA